MSGMEITDGPRIISHRLDPQAQLCRDYHSIVCAPVHLSLTMLLCAGTNGNLKRLGKFLEGSSCKKQAVAPTMLHQVRNMKIIWIWTSSHKGGDASSVGGVD